MGDCMEILFTSETNGQHFTCCAWDIRNGTNLMTYKGGGAANANGIDFIREEFMVSANSTKPLVHIWPINSQDQISGMRFVLPGKANALAVSPDGNYLAAGIQEVLYIWEIRTGRMINSLSKHYQNINALKFTDDGSHLISAGQDGGVLVWNVTKIVGDNDSNILPLYSFNDHALPVTGIHVGCGGIRSILFTVSLDSTCRVYDLATGTLLLNIGFNEALTCVTCNKIESMAFVGTVGGNIYEFNLVSAPRTKEYHLAKEDYTNNLVATGMDKVPIKCLALSLDGETLVSGGDDNNVYVWHIPSRQLLRTLPHKGQISNLIIRLNNRNMFKLEKKYNLIAGNLKRMMENKNPSDDSEIIEVDVRESLFEDEVFMKPTGTLTSLSSSGDSSNNSAEIDRLREEVQKLTKANQELFQYSLKNCLSKK